MDVLSEKIVVLAADMFSLYGLKSVSIDDLCKKMSISKKTFYGCFATKEELVGAVLEHKNLKLAEQFMRFKDKGNAIDELLAFMGMHRLWASKTQEKSPTMLYDLQKYYPALWEKSAQQKEQFARDFFSSNIRRGIEEKLYREEIDIDMLCVYFGFNHTLQIFERMNAYLKDRKLTNQEIAMFIMDILARYITTPLGWDILVESAKALKKRANVKSE